MVEGEGGGSSFCSQRRPESFQRLILDMIHEDPSQRPSASTILQRLEGECSKKKKSFVV